METTFTVYHSEHVSSRSFEEVVSAFESAVGSVEDTGFPALLAATKTAEEFESRIKSREGTSGFMRFLTVDHGDWMARIGLNAKARMYTIGNPLIARTMLGHDVAAGLNVPVRLMIYEDAVSRTTRLAYEKAGCQTHCSRHSRYRRGGLTKKASVSFVQRSLTEDNEENEGFSGEELLRTCCLVRVTERPRPFKKKLRYLRFLLFDSSRIFDRK